MSQSIDGNDQNQDGSDEFDFYFRFTKPLVIYLPTEEDRSIAAAWVEKLEAEPETEQEKRLRLDYLKLLLFVLQRGRLSGIFRKQPPAGPLQPFPLGFNVSDMGNLMIDQDDIQGCGGGDMRLIPYTVEISNDLREFVAAQEIPNFGVQMYYAWSSDDPINKWSQFDEEKFPQYVLDKIKLLKEIKSDEKAGLSTKGCGAKKICDIPLMEKYTKTKVKSPQEIEKAQGRSYQTYMGLIGQLGRGFKDVCDDDPDKFNKPGDQRRGKCPRKTQRKCSPGQTVYSGDLTQTNEEYDNFLSGLSGNTGNRSRGCPCPNPAHSQDCSSQMKQQYDNQQQQQPGRRSCSPKSRSEMPASAWEQPVAREMTRKNQMNHPGGPCPGQFAMGEDMEMNSCPSQRRSMSPPNKGCISNRTELSPPPNNCQIPSRNGNLANSSQSCACPCPRDESQSSSKRPGPSCPSSAPARPNGDRCLPQPMKLWTTPNDASFQGLAGLKRCTPPENETMPCYDQQSQGPLMNQQQERQDDTWCCNMDEVPDSRMKDKNGKQMGINRRDEERMDRSPNSRSYQTSSNCPPHQAPSGYSFCSPPTSPQMQRSNKMQDRQDSSRRNARMQQQDMDYCPDVDGNMQGAYGMAPTQNSNLGPSGGAMAGFGNQSWRSQGPSMAGAKSLNFDYQSELDDGCNDQYMNRSNGANVDPCSPRMKDPCSPPQRTMPNRSKMQSPGAGPSMNQNASGGRLYDMVGVIDGIKQRTEAHREKCESAGARKPMANDDNFCGRNVQRQQYCPPPQPQCPPPSPMKACPSLGGERAMAASQYANSSPYSSPMNKQSQQAYCPPQQTRKPSPPIYETYNTQKGMQNMGMMASCPPSQSPGNFRGPNNYSQGMNPVSMTGDECPQRASEEEDEDCMLSAAESADERPPGSSTSGEFLQADEDAEMMDDVQCATWPQTQEPKSRARGYLPMQEQKTREFMQMMPPENTKKKGGIVCSTPKQSPYGACDVNYGDSNRQIEQTYQNYYALPDTSCMEENHRVQRSPCGPSAQNEQRFAPEQSRAPRPRAKDQRQKRGGPSICDDYAQFDNCKTSCGL